GRGRGVQHRVRGQWKRTKGRKQRAQRGEAGGRDADNGERVSFGSNATADPIRPSAETLLPQPMTDDRNRRRIERCRLDVLGTEQASRFGANAKLGEETSAHEPACGAPPI